MANLVVNTPGGVSVGLTQLLASQGTGLLPGSGGVTMGGGTTFAQPVGGGPAFVGNSSGGTAVRPYTAPAVPQTDLLPLNGTTSFVVDLGVIIRFLDSGGVATPTVAPGDINLVTPDGTLHDLWALLTFLDAQNSGMPFTLPPGRYTFLNTSGGALAGVDVRVQHVGAKNLI